MNIVEIYEKFPTEQHCIKYLESVRWQGEPQCPYCLSKSCSPMPKENRHHCNNCNTTFSVTVRTIFHKTRMPLQKWFLAISLVLNAKKGISARQLGRHLKVNKDTAWSIAMRIRGAMIEDRRLMTGIVEMDETYVGGKHRGKTPNRLMARGTNKIPVAGIIERGGRVMAAKVKDAKRKTLKSLIRGNIDVNQSLLTTDSYPG